MEGHLVVMAGRLKGCLILFFLKVQIFWKVYFDLLIVVGQILGAPGLISESLPLLLD